MAIKYRLMEKKDVPSVFKVDQECFKHHWTEKSYEDESNNLLAHYIVAEHEEEIIGFGGFWSVIDEAQITNIGVSKAFRKQGIGQKILEKMIKLAAENGCLGMTLEVREDNIPALVLYEGNGFIREGLRKNYYDHKINGIIMWRYDLG